MHSSGSARVVAYCPRLADAAIFLWQGEARRRAGIRPGMPLAEATALAMHHAGALHLEMHDPLADQLALTELAAWCQRFSPTAGVEEDPQPESLLLDVTGLGALCGGEWSLACRVVQEFRERSLNVRVAIADTPGAAWAVCHFATTKETASDPLAEPLVVPSQGTWRAIAPLSIEALRLPVVTCQLLAELGLRRIEQVAQLPRPTLLARFGPLLLARLDQACGTAAEAIAGCRPPGELEFCWPLEHPTERREMIDFALEELISRACRALACERRGVLRLQCHFAYETQPASEFVVGLYRPSACPRHVGELVRLKFEALQLRAAVATISLRVLAADRLELRQQQLSFDAQQHHQRDPQALATLVDRLSNRLGSAAVSQPWLLASAQPEYACQYRSLASLATRRQRVKTKSTSHASSKRSATADAISPPIEPPGDRPLKLEPRPQPLAVVSVAPEGPPMLFRLAGSEHRVVRVWGPERIETSWWRGRCVRRDYYQVETATGSRFWLFRQLNSGQWFLHGEFA